MSQDSFWFISSLTEESKQSESSVSLLQQSALDLFSVIIPVHIKLLKLVFTTVSESKRVFYGGEQSHREMI